VTRISPVFSGANDTGEKFIAGVNDTGNLSLSQGNKQKA
jgi:hypothetical protein